MRQPLCPSANVERLVREPLFVPVPTVLINGLKLGCVSPSVIIHSSCAHLPQSVRVLHAVRRWCSLSRDTLRP